jgi:L-fuculose-phosphate aldolase
MTVDDLGLVDMDGKQLVGSRPRSSEILLHLEIMKAVPQATAVLHCHPPYATAYAITGLVPPACIIPEQEVFVGTVALSPYETPGTQAFAETVLPYVREHNTILLSNHGIVCWADTVTHAEWYAEVVDTYCHTLVIASHLGSPLTKIPAEKAAHLLDLKKKLGMPDARYGLQECHLCDQPEFPGGVTACPARPPSGRPETKASDGEVEQVVQAVTDQVMAALKARA